MATFRYSVSNKLPGMFLPDSIRGPYVGHTRRELAEIVRDELRAMDWPAGLFSKVRIKNLWRQIARYGSSSMHFSIVHDNYELSFQGLTEDEAEQMERENE